MCRQSAAAGPSQEDSVTLIPRPQGSEFSLQEAMGLEDDYQRYVDLRVSSGLFFRTLFTKPVTAQCSSRFATIRRRPNKEMEESRLCKACKSQGTCESWHTLTAHSLDVFTCRSLNATIFSQVPG